VLELSVDAARDLLAAHSRLSRLLGTLSEVGLGYLRLGQNAATLSGGEAQRVRLSRELGGARPAARSTCSTSPRPACTSTTSAACSRCSGAWSTPGTRSS
jgi:hypothetical protein